MIYTALGDSITAGESATSPSRSYPSLIFSRLRTCSRHAFANTLAEPGWTSEALVHAILQSSILPLQQSTAISIWVGGDNLAAAGMAIFQGASPKVLASAMKSYARDLRILVSFIRKVSKARIVFCTQYNPFPHTPLATEAIDRLNQITEETAARLNVALAPVHEWFAGNQAELIAGYRTGTLQDVLKSPEPPVHPNDKGHGVIAKGLFPFVYGGGPT